ncbi:MAG: BCCT family transporter [Opitutales bacterium]|nr:BCCT family transporter [Opitutales bacterium]
MSLFFILYAVFVPDHAAATFGRMQLSATENAGWFYVMAVAGFLVFIVFLGVSRFGRIKLGTIFGVGSVSRFRGDPGECGPQLSF